MPTPLTKEQKTVAKKQRAQDREWARKEREHNKLINRELKVLRFMKKTGVLYYHHTKSDKIDIETVIKEVKSNNRHDVWKWHTQQSESRCLLDCKFRSSEFESIYDVPLDGSHIFQMYDSGERGLYAQNRITAVKVEEKPVIPHVNPGAIIPITAN